MANCAQCNAPVENEAMTGLFCLKCNNKAAGIDEGSFKDPITMAGLGFGIGALIVRLQVNGVEYISLAGGIGAVILGAFGIVRAMKAPEDARKKKIGLAAVAVVLGLYHVVRGFSGE